MTEEIYVLTGMFICLCFYLTIMSGVIVSNWVSYRKAKKLLKEQEAKYPKD